MVPGVRIREAVPADVAGIYAVTYRGWQAAYDGILSASILDSMTPPESGVPADQRDWLLEVIEREDMAELVAVDGSAVRGFVELLWRTEKTRDFVEPGDAELGSIYVDPDCWGRGIGTRLLDRGVRSLPGAVSRLKLGVLSGNERAKAFYERRGFEHIGTATIRIGSESYVEDVYARPL